AIHQPVLNLLCVGDNQTTMLNDRPVRMRDVDSLAQATLLVTDARAVGTYQNQAGFERLMKQAGLFRTWGDCWGYLLLAAGRADIMLDPIMKPWDILPLIPVVQGAGGVITAWDGSAAVGADSCVAAGKKLHTLVLEALNG
ncbi:MAG: inositol monophosphatase family protein, partial [Terriglobia bacterium]